MRPVSVLALVAALNLPACGSSEGTAPSPSGSAAASAAPAASAAAAPKATRLEKVSMNGVAWEVTLPADMRAPQYEVKNPEYLGDDDLSLNLSNAFPKFSSLDAYISRNVPKVISKKQVGDVHFVISEPQKAGMFYMTGMVPNDTIGWHCHGAQARAAEIQAMCESVKFKRE